MVLTDEERKAKEKARRQTPEYKAKKKEYQSRPEIKVKSEARRKSPQSKAKQKEYQSRPEIKVKAKERSRKPEYKETRQKYNLRPESKSKKKEISQRPENKKLRNEYTSKLRLELLKHYSKLLSKSDIPCCNCCGENTYIEFLALDHIKGRKQMDLEPELVKLGYSSKLVSSQLIAWIIKNNFPEGFQILCHNCNNAKGFYGKCPHEMK